MPTSSLTKFYAFVEALAEKVHNLGSDQLMVALTNTAPNLTDTQLSNITQISYTNLASNPSSRQISLDNTGGAGTGSQQTTGTYKLKLTDLTLTASGGSVGPFRYVVIYNDTATNDELIGYLDYGSSITLADGEQILINFDGSAGVLTIQ